MFGKVKILLIAFALAFGALVQAEPVHVELVAEQEAIQPGQSFWVGVHFALEEGWHIYWKNPGESGLPTTMNWQLPEGITLGKTEWPHPSRFEHDDTVAFGYEEDVMVLAELIAHEELTLDQHLSISLEAEWLACRDLCMPGGANAALELPVAAEVHPANEEIVSKFAQARLLVPQKAPLIESVREGGDFVLHLDTQIGVELAQFFPEEEGTVGSRQIVNVSRTDRGVTVRLPTEGAAVSALKGVVVLSSGVTGESLAYQIDTSTGSSQVWEDALLPTGSRSMGTILLALGLAFLGGLILNLMPCVLPVVSLKIFHFLNMAGDSRKQAVRHGLLFTLGVVVSFWALAVALFVLKALGSEVGWGFQLQEPVFVAVLVIGLFLFGLSLLGVFEFGTSLQGVGAKAQGKQGSFGTFMSGVLATVVATPCTGPLLAPALGFAVSLPPMVAMLIFTSIALGLASPYLLLSAYPRLLRWLPKPGNWMIAFKQIMGFFMIGTVLWLIWVFQAEVGSELALMALLFALLVVALAAWIFGRWGTPMQKRPLRYLARIITVALLAFGTMVGVAPAKSASIEHTPSGDWLSWDPSQVESLRREGKPVFVDFTAKWCLICQTNKAPMHSSGVEERFRERGVVKMEADYTRRDPQITKELAKYGRSGVPLYLLYGPDPSQPPIVLPQLLTPQVLIDSLEQIDEP